MTFIQRPNSSKHGASQTAAGLNPGESEECVWFFLVWLLEGLESGFQDLGEFFVFGFLLDF